MKIDRWYTFGSYRTHADAGRCCLSGSSVIFRLGLEVFLAAAPDDVSVSVSGAGAGVRVDVSVVILVDVSFAALVAVAVVAMFAVVDVADVKFLEDF